MIEPNLDTTRDPRAVSAVQALSRASRMLERSLHGLSPADFRVLSAIAGGDARASRLATRLALGKPAISASIDSLCRRGLVERGIDAADQRVNTLSLTPAGEDARVAAEKGMVAVVADLAARTGDGGRMLDALAGLNDAIEQRQQEIVAARRSARTTDARGAAARGAAREARR